MKNHAKYFNCFKTGIPRFAIRYDIYYDIFPITKHQRQIPVADSSNTVEYKRILFCLIQT